MSEISVSHAVFLVGVERAWNMLPGFLLEFEAIAVKTQGVSHHFQNSWMRSIAEVVGAAEWLENSFKRI